MNVSLSFGLQTLFDFAENKMIEGYLPSLPLSLT